MSKYIYRIVCRTGLKIAHTKFDSNRARAIITRNHLNRIARQSNGDELYEVWRYDNLEDVEWENDTFAKESNKYIILD